MVRLSLAAALLLAVTGFAARAEESVSVESVRSLGQAPFFIAQEKGYFVQEGLKIEGGEVRSALDAVASLSTGRLDVSMGAPTAGFFNAAHGGFDLRAVAALGIQGPVMATQPLVRKELWDNGTIRSGKDLKGRKVAVNVPGDMTEFFLTLILEKYGMSLKDVDETVLAFQQQVIAFRNGAIDAGFLPEPVSTTAKNEGFAVLQEPDAGAGAGSITTMVFFGKKFIDERPKVAQAFLRALIRAARETQGAYNKNPELAALIGKAMNLPVEAVQAATPYAFDPDLDIAKYVPSLQKEEAVQRKNGRLTYAEPLSFDTLVDAKLVHEAAASVK